MLLGKAVLTNYRRFEFVEYQGLQRVIAQCRGIGFEEEYFERKFQRSVPLTIIWGNHAGSVWLEGRMT